MAEIRALRKHPCPSCGGDAEWNAAKQSLVCPYCGTHLEWNNGEEIFGGAIQERDLLSALKEYGKEGTGLRAEKRSVRCESCNAISIFDPDRAAQRCDFCGSPSIVPVDTLDTLITPESLIPASVPGPKVRDLLRRWYGTRWFAPNRLRRAAMTDTLHGIYLPYWTFDAHADANWTAQSGYHYYVSESYTDAQGRSSTRQVRKTRWKPSSGRLKHFFDDDLVPGSIGVHYDLLRKVEPFPTTHQLKPYDPAYVRGWTVERYQVDLGKAAEINRQQMEAALRVLCGKQVPGDTYRALQVQADYQGRTFKHILVPIWIASYTYGRRSFQVVINGATEKMAGEYPKSWVKIFFAVLSALILVLVILYYTQ